jgi:methionyl-tRNA formyltransferase
MAYGQILKDDFLAATRLGFINFHGSLLPALRGATPVESALALGFKSTGISVQHVVRKLDAGPLYASSELSVLPNEGRVALRQRLGETAAKLSNLFLDKILNQKIIPQPQDESLVTYTRRLDRQDASLDFKTPAEEIVGRVRALEGWPGSTFPLGDLIIKVGSAGLRALMDDFKNLGGEAIEVVTSNHTQVQVHRFADYAQHYGLMASRGSDYHGPGESFTLPGRMAALPSICKPVWQAWS